MHSPTKVLTTPEEALFRIRRGIETLDDIRGWMSWEAYIDLRRALVNAYLDELALRSRPYDQEGERAEDVAPPTPSSVLPPGRDEG